MDAPHSHRTRSRAKQTVQVPTILNVPSTGDMQYALTLVSDSRETSGGKPHLVALQQGNHDDALTQTLDLMPLRVICSALIRDLVPHLTPDTPVSRVREHRKTIYIPEMLVTMGVKCNMGDTSRASFLRKLNEY